MDAAVPVLVLNSGHHGALGIARSLGRLGVPVYLIDSNRQAPAFRSRYCRGSYVWDFHAASEEHSVEFLIGIARKIACRAVLVPTDDAGALFVAGHAPELRKWYVFPQSSFELVSRLHNKKQMHLSAQQAGIPTPNAYFPESQADVLHVAGHAIYPLILKTIEGTPNPRSPLKPVVRDKNELLARYQQMVSPGCPHVMIQEYIPGGKAGSWMFNGYFNAASDCLFGSTGKKLRQNPPDAGITSLGACLPNAQIASTTKDFIKTIAYRGIVDVDYIYDSRDGLYKVVDVNPRIGCTFRLFVSDTGMDVMRALYLDLTGQTVEEGNLTPNRKWIAEPADIASSYRDWARGGIKLNDWLRSFQGLQEFAYLAVDDPYPLMGMMAKYFRAYSSPKASPGDSESPKEREGVQRFTR